MKHFSHECALTSPEIVTYGVCNICYKDEPVELACKPCQFDLCKACSKLPQKVSHDFHPDHPLELCLRQFDRKPLHVICSGCGNMFTGSLYECKECEIYLDLGCALLKNIFTAWDAKEMLHYSHCHLLRRSRPGLKVYNLCLLCELPVSPSVICYGCVYCCLFVHERCLDLPREIQHPVHSAHPLRRLDYTHNCNLRTCDACGLRIYGPPLSCVECDFDLHLRCADSLLRGLLQESHNHRLFYVNNNATRAFFKGSPCQICMRTDIISLDSYYKCVECDLKFHFECLQIPQCVVKKSYHIHPLVCKVFLAEDDLEYCGVCETMVHAKHHVYSCEECDFLGHIGCILREEQPSPLYLKDLFSCGEDIITRPTTNQEDCESSNLENKLMVNDYKHTHVMKSVGISELPNDTYCKICHQRILGSPFKCESCTFWTHKSCAELGKPSTHRLHMNHPLTLLTMPPMYALNLLKKCDNCLRKIDGFNLFCRICNFMIDIRCALKGKDVSWVLKPKVFGALSVNCIRYDHHSHSVVEAIISRAESLHCVICDERLHGKAMACMECQEIYHPWCIEAGRRKLSGHPFHYDHMLQMLEISKSTCIACKLIITNIGYTCSDCKVNFHIKCIQEASVSSKIKSHQHNLYNFWIDDSQFTRACGVCTRPCEASFYGCVGCSFYAHVECLGFPDNVKNQQHQHSVSNTYVKQKGSCSLCGGDSRDWMYTCNHCNDVFHMECIMSTDDREAATEEEQRQDIYLTYLEHDLLKLLQKTQ